jgi:asparagine synthase (glutamine-hydrolysing)
MRSAEELYLHLMSQWKRPAELLAAGTEPRTRLSDPDRWPRVAFTSAMMLQDIGMYLPDDILVKVDRASMAVSLEARVPLLDHRVVEFAWRLPAEWKLRGGTGKWILRRVLERHVPRSLFERPKTGFGVPLAAWLRGPLKAWGEEYLDESRLQDGGYLRAAPIRDAWRAHQSGRSNLQYPLWSVLTFQAWLDAQASAPARTVRTGIDVTTEVERAPALTGPAASSPATSAAAPSHTRPPRREREGVRH